MAILTAECIAQEARGGQGTPADLEGSAIFLHKLFGHKGYNCHYHHHHHHKGGYGHGGHGGYGHGGHGGYGHGGYGH